MRSLGDGSVARRVDAPVGLTFLGVDEGGRFVARGPDLHLRDPQTLEIVRSVEADVHEAKLADGKLTVVDKAGKQNIVTSLGAITPLRPTLRAQSSLSGYRTSGHPRVRIERRGKLIGEFLTPRLFGEEDGDLLLVSDVDLDGRESTLARVGADGTGRYETPLGRPGREVAQAVRAGELLIVTLNAPLELVAMDVATGAVRWRVHP